MAVNVSVERIERTHFVLRAIYGSSALPIVGVFSIFGFVWQADVLTSASFVTVMVACYEPWVAYQ